MKRRRVRRPTGETVICPFCGDPADVEEVIEHTCAGDAIVSLRAWCPTCGNDFNPEKC